MPPLSTTSFNRTTICPHVVSQNLGVLRKAGLLTERREANRRYHRANPAALGSLRAAIEEMWTTDLDRLRNVVEGG